MALTPEQILNIAGTPAAIPGSYIYSVARAIETEVRKQDTELIRQMRDALDEADDVLIEEYRQGIRGLVERCAKALAAANARLEGKP